MKKLEYAPLVLKKMKQLKSYLISEYDEIVWGLRKIPRIN